MNRNGLLTTFFLIACLWLPSWSSAQAPKTWTAGEIHEAMKKLNVLGTALYIAAHPDDENTRMISYLSNERHIQTTYLSLTRGDGGQNLIGNEISELLGIIRTQELLAARRIDGGEQTFSRAIDFGFSKHPDETLEIWQKDEVLSDVVWAIRKYQPDIIINRFDHNSPGTTHGHHTSSAILSVEAFDLANDPTAFPEQLKYVSTWQPERLYFNTSWWFYGSQEKFEKADKSKMVSMDVGVYYPIKGKSNTEIAAESRSQHRCQGMGRPLDRGTSLEYLQLLQGDMPKDQRDPLAGIDLTWNRIQGGQAIGEALQEIEKNFRYDAPHESVPALISVYQEVQLLPESKWKRLKSEELKTVIRACMALFLEANAQERTSTPGELVEVAFEVVNRSPVPASLLSIEFLNELGDTTLNLDLTNNEVYEFYQKVTIPKNATYTSPYWLDQPAELGIYTVTDQLQRGLPETPPYLNVRFNMLIGGQPFKFVEAIRFKDSDPVEGETYQPFEVLPPVFAKISEKVYVFAGATAKEVTVTVQAGKEMAKGSLRLDVPKGWRTEPASHDFELAIKGAEQQLTFQLFPPENQSEGNIRAKVKLDGKIYDQELVLIEYSHIPIQSVLRPAQAKAVKIDLQKAGDRIGYIMGAGDEIPASLQQIGYQVDLLDDESINLKNLQQYDAIILGIRAYNTVNRIKFHQPVLLEYVQQGGTMIVQYNTTWQLDFPMEEIAPYPLQISRDRVTVEDAPVRFLKPSHPILNQPNKITQADFEGWVQERGLYFPDKWGEEFEAILSSNDPGETPKDGGLLVAKYGKGHYIYTGYSWFRELPAGVPGAYRLFTNLISLGQEKQP